ncbi:hypothetical protein INR49_012706 [Caranx melampygus]|nr:hypothetical protein INR49_012706 [Caranx melampygus]
MKWQEGVDSTVAGKQDHGKGMTDWPLAADGPLLPLTMDPAGLLAALTPQLGLVLRFPQTPSDQAAIWFAIGVSNTVLIIIANVGRASGNAVDAVCRAAVLHRFPGDSLTTITTAGIAADAAATTATTAATAATAASTAAGATDTTTVSSHVQAVAIALVRLHSGLSILARLGSDSVVGYNVIDVPWCSGLLLRCSTLEHSVEHLPPCLFDLFRRPAYALLEPLGGKPQFDLLFGEL